MIRFSLMASLVLGLSMTLVGCDGKSDYKPVTEVKKGDPLPDHEHGEKGPHGGGIIELGKEEYHAEIVVDHDAHAVAVYVLGKDAKTAVPVTATEITVTPEGKSALTLKAAPQKDDGDGKASKFDLEDHDLVHELMDAGFLHGELRITIADSPYIGHIDYHINGEGHEHHEHDDKSAPKPPGK